MQISQSLRKWRLDPSWPLKVSPVLSHILHGPLTAEISTWWYCSGCCFWAARVFLIPSSQLARIRSFMSHIGQIMATSHLSFVTQVIIGKATHANLLWMASLISQNQWRSWLTPTRMLTGVSDASTQGAGWVTTSISCLWAWPLRLTPNLVFQLEFLTAFNAFFPHPAVLAPATFLPPFALVQRFYPMISLCPHLSHSFL